MGKGRSVSRTRDGDEARKDRQAKFLSYRHKIRDPYNKHLVRWLCFFVSVKEGGCYYTYDTHVRVLSSVWSVKCTNKCSFLI